MASRAEELIACLEAEIVKRDARIAELEAPMLAWAELDYTKHTRRSLMCYIGQQNFRITAQENKLAALKAQQPSSTVHLLFDGPPGPECGRFVEAEDPTGKSINAGEWSHRPDGYWQLVIQQPSAGVVLPEPFDVRPFQTIDRGSVNYMAGFNAAIRKMRESVGRAQQQEESGQ